MGPHSTIEELETKLKAAVEAVAGANATAAAKSELVNQMEKVTRQRRSHHHIGHTSATFPPGCTGRDCSCWHFSHKAAARNEECQIYGFYNDGYKCCIVFYGCRSLNTRILHPAL